MKPFITTSAATGREYWRLRRVEREKLFIFFVIAEMIIVAAAILFGLTVNRGKSGKIVLDAYFALTIAFGVAAILLGVLYLLFYFWYGYRPVKNAEVKIDVEAMTLETDLVGFTGKTKHVVIPIEYYSDNGVYTRIGKNKRHFIWLADKRMNRIAKKGFILIGEKLNGKKNEEKPE